MTNKPKLEQPGQGFPGLSQRLLKEPALRYFVTGHRQLTLCGPFQNVLAVGVDGPLRSTPLLTLERGQSVVDGRAQLCIC